MIFRGGLRRPGLRPWTPHRHIFSIVFVSHVQRSGIGWELPDRRRPQRFIRTKDDILALLTFVESLDSGSHEQICDMITDLFAASVENPNIHIDLSPVIESDPFRIIVLGSIAMADVQIWASLMEFLTEVAKLTADIDSFV